MHCLMITNDTNFAYNLRREVLYALLERGYQTTLAGEILGYREELEASGCTLRNIQTNRHGTSVLQDIKLFFQYFSVLRKEKPDLVLTNNIKPNVYAGMACRLLGIPYIPNITGLGTAVEYDGPMQKLTTMLYKTGIAGASAVLFQNEENVEFFRKRRMLSARSEMVLLPGSGVNLDSHPVLCYSQAGEIHFLFIARVMKEKGIDLYLGAARRIRACWPNAVFHICGGCDDAAYVQILRQEQAAGNVIYHGLQKDMTPFFEMCHCVVHPSYYPEGMSNVLLEAAASGRPIIATDRSGCRETVDHGISGYRIPVRDEDGLVAALEAFLALDWDKRREMGLAGRAKMEREFDRNMVVETYLQLIRKYTADEEMCYGL